MEIPELSYREAMIYKMKAATPATATAPKADPSLLAALTVT